MNNLEYRVQLDEALLPPESRTADSIETESSSDNNGEFCKATTLILVVLFVCGILALGISVIVWHFWNNQLSGYQIHQLVKTIGIVVVLLLCGILALGLPAAVWKYYEKLDSGEPITTIPLQEISVPDPVINDITAPPVHEKRVIGYYNEFDSKDIRKSQLSKLTHAIFACVQMSSGGKIQFKGSKSEQRFLSLKKKSKHVESSVKVMFSIGGADNSEHFSTVMGSWRRKRKFINSIISFIKEHQIDGVNLFWEQPGESNKFKYSKFIKKLRKRLDEQEKKVNKQLVLSIVAPRAGIDDWESGFDLDGIVEHVDFVNVLSMDYYEALTNQQAGPSAPLYSGVGPRKNFNVDYTMRYYIGETQQPGKFNIVIPFYVRLWRNVKEKLKPDSKVFRNVELEDGKAHGDFYMSRATVEHDGFKLTPASWDGDTKTAYIYDHAARTFLTFENEKSLTEKMKFVNSMSLGGVWIWSIHTDDDNETLLDSLISNNNVLNNKSKYSRSSVLELV